MKNQKGITLIALVVTIIVLLILAGVSIAMLTGDNGILKQSNQATVTNIEARVEEEINLALQACRLAIENETAKDASWNTAIQGIKTQTTIADNATNSTSGFNKATDGVIMSTLAADLKTSGNSKYTISVSATQYAAHAADVADDLTTANRVITVVYRGSDYEKATNTVGATITYKFNVTQHNIVKESAKPVYNPVHAQ